MTKTTPALPSARPAGAAAEANDTIGHDAATRDPGGRRVAGAAGLVIPAVLGLLFLGGCAGGSGDTGGEPVRPAYEGDRMWDIHQRTMEQFAY